MSTILTNTTLSNSTLIYNKSYITTQLLLLSSIFNKISTLSFTKGNTIIKLYQDSNDIDILSDSNIIEFIKTDNIIYKLYIDMILTSRKGLLDNGYYIIYISSSIIKFIVNGHSVLKLFPVVLDVIINSLNDIKQELIWSNLKLPLLFIKSILSKSDRSNKEIEFLSNLILKAYISALPSDVKILPMDINFLDSCVKDHCIILSLVYCNYNIFELNNMITNNYRSYNALFFVMNLNFDSLLSSNVKSKRDLLISFSKSLITNKINLLLCQKQIEPTIQLYLKLHGILCVERLGLRGTILLKSLSVPALSAFTYHATDIIPLKLKIIDLNDKKFLDIESTSSTLIIPNSGREKSCINRNMDREIGDILGLFKFTKNLLPGKGGSEKHISLKLVESVSNMDTLLLKFNLPLDRKTKYYYNEFFTYLTKMFGNYHIKLNDPDTEIYDSYECKKRAIEIAFDIAKTMLNIGDIIKDSR